ncbi:cation:proton antiporter [Micromonospora sp. WMMD1082]|uniref:cation:proton antiporter n=1 Tax=Micromonospora sp. WMMD1082 TaxID=3016104 RepID=UPI0024161535|nr:cation:proton antiporter [Micromonospora sp. WMMD1082]MDG4797009.1 cation:proton antiporter [Micromonospora sp. WMMD1082]
MNGAVGYTISALHSVIALALVLAAAYLFRRLARLIGQTGVVGEITLGLLAGPLVLAIGGAGAAETLLPADVLAVLQLCGHVGLVLFLVATAAELTASTVSLHGRGIAWVTAGALFPSLAAGAALAGWLLWLDDPNLRGDAPQPAFLIFITIALAVSAVPVLARIITDHGLTGTRAAKLSLSSAVVVDAIAWLLLGLAVGLAGTGTHAALTGILVLVGGLGTSLLLRRLLAAATVPPVLARHPYPVAVAVAAVALVAAHATESGGLTAISGAFLVGLCLPARDPWMASAVRRVNRVGTALLPAFFVATGLTVWTAQTTAVPWLIITAATVLAVAGKTLGSYVGARLAGETRHTARRVGVLLNARGLTEIALLQAGHAAGIVTGELYLALVVMALVTTAMTGWWLRLMDRRQQEPTAVAAHADTDPDRSPSRSGPTGRHIR